MLLISFWPGLMYRFGVSPELIEPMRPFLQALNWGTLPLLAYFALRRYLQAVNVVHPIMFALVSANLVNFVGDWALIYGHLGFPAMGITGSGWSTCFARIYMAGVLANFLYVESKRWLPRWTSAVRIDLRRVWALLELGAPAATQILLEIGASRRHRAGGQAGSGPALGSRDRVELRRARLHGAAGNQFRRRGAGGTTIGKKRSGGSAARRMVRHHARRRIHGLLGTAVRVDSHRSPACSPPIRW